MVTRAINDKFDSWYLKGLLFPRPKESENYDAPQLPLGKFIVNCTRNHATTSTNIRIEITIITATIRNPIVQLVLNTCNRYSTKLVFQFPQKW